MVAVSMSDDPLLKTVARIAMAAAEREERGEIVERGQRVMAEDNKPTTLYRYYDGHGDLLYVGITNTGHGRAEDHVRGAVWWPMAVKADFRHYPTRAAAMDAEMEAIKNEVPRFNIQGSPLPRAYVDPAVSPSQALTVRYTQRTDVPESTRNEGVDTALSFLLADSEEAA